jgi:hypothetical protein
VRTASSAKPAAAGASAKGGAAPKPARPPKVAFPKKARPPTDAEFAARLPAAVGKRFEAVRAFLDKQGAEEGFYFYGPRTGWAYRYLLAEKSLCSIVLQSDRLIGILALDATAQAAVTWDELSDVARRARRVAHGTPALLWLDIPLDGTGAVDFRKLLKAKLARR